MTLYNFVTKRGMCAGYKSKISWTQVETGSAITWKYPSCVLKGDGSVGEFYSIAVTNNMQQADTGTKMIHIGKDTSSTIISKGISSDRITQEGFGETELVNNCFNDVYCTEAEHQLNRRTEFVLIGKEDILNNLED